MEKSKSKPNRIMWTKERTATLIKWYTKYTEDVKNGKMKPDSSVYQKVANRIHASYNSVYKKIGKLGLIDVPWSKKYMSSK